MLIEIYCKLKLQRLFIIFLSIYLFLRSKGREIQMEKLIKINKFRKNTIEMHKHLSIWILKRLSRVFKRSNRPESKQHLIVTTGQSRFKPRLFLKNIKIFNSRKNDSFRNFFSASISSVYRYGLIVLNSI